MLWSLLLDISSNCVLVQNYDIDFYNPNVMKIGCCNIYNLEILFKLNAC